MFEEDSLFKEGLSIHVGAVYRITISHILEDMPEQRVGRFSRLQGPYTCWS